MPIQVERVTLSSTDPRVRPSDCTLDRHGGASHLALLSPSAFALMDDSFYREGVLLAYSPPGKSSFVSVVHARGGKRTSVCQAPTNLTDFACYAEQFKWLAEGSPTSFIDILIIYRPNSRPSSTLHTSLRSAAPQNITLDFSAEPQPSPASLVEVTKVTAKTRILQIPIGYVHDPIGTSATQDDSRTDTFWDVILAVEAAYRRVKGQPPRSPPMQYDGKGIVEAPPRPSDEVETLLKEACEENRLARGIGRRGFDEEMLENLVVAMSAPHLDTPQFTLDYALLGHQSFGAYCARCGNDRHLLKCSGCGWAAYCSRAHQREDWKHHRSW